MSASYSNVNYGAAVNSVSMNAAITNAIAPLTSTVSNLVPKTTTVNGHALSGNVVISASDIGLDNVSNLSAINVPLTGYASGAGTISATDTILSAINKLSGNITAVSIIANNSYNALGSMFNNQVGTTYTTTLNDSTFSNNPGKVLTFNNAATQTVTIPPNSSVACPIGATIQAVQLGVGKVTFIGGSGVTINSAGGLKSIAIQYGAVTLMQTAIDVWVLIGTLIA